MTTDEPQAGPLEPAGQQATTVINYMPVRGFFRGPRPGPGTQVVVHYVAAPAELVAVQLWQPEEHLLLYRTSAGELLFADLLIPE